MYWLIGYIAASIFSAACLAYRVGKHRGMHVRGSETYFLKNDGRSIQCDHTYCDSADLGILYFLALCLLPVFLFLVGSAKFLGLIQKGGFNSVQLPENSHPGIEIKEVNLNRQSSGVWGFIRFVFFVIAVILSLTSLLHRFH